MEIYCLLIRSLFLLMFLAIHGFASETQNRTSSPLGVTNPSPRQLSCQSDPSICNKVCNEVKRLAYSATFCDARTGTCVCDCRDRISHQCEKTPFTPCFQECVKENPNPDAFLYEGGNCPITRENGTVDFQCACECSFRESYEETNDIYEATT